jgi:hypothetical protein
VLDRVLLRNFLYEDQIKKEESLLHIHDYDRDFEKVVDRLGKV